MTRSQCRYVDRDSILIQPEGGTSIHPGTIFSERDASAALFMLDQLGYDILIFGWLEDGIIRTIDGDNEIQISEI